MLAALAGVSLIGMTTYLFARDDTTPNRHPGSLDTRLAVLQGEQRSEALGLQAATRRLAERQAVGDETGVLEARRAIERHQKSLQALERETQHVKRTAPAAPTPAFAGTSASIASSPRPWWDVYRSATESSTRAAGHLAVPLAWPLGRPPGVEALATPSMNPKQGETR